MIGIIEVKRKQRQLTKLIKNYGENTKKIFYELIPRSYEIGQVSEVLKKKGISVPIPKKTAAKTRVQHRIILSIINLH